MATAQSTHSFFFFFRKESHKTTDSPEEGQQQRTVPPEEALPAGLPQNTAHRAARPGTAQLPAAPRPPSPRGDPLSFPLTPGRGTGTERGGGAPAPGEGEGHEAEDGEAEEGDGVRPVEELQRDVLHLLLVDHAEMQAVVHVVFAQGPAPHARRHLDPFPSALLARARRRRRRGENRRARRAEGRTQRCRSPTRREKAGGVGGAEPPPRVSGGMAFSPSVSPLPAPEWSRPSACAPPPRSRPATRRGCWAGEAGVN